MWLMGDVHVLNDGPDTNKKNMGCKIMYGV